MTWQTLLARMMTLSGMQNIPCVQEYAEAWKKLADDCQSIGLSETAKNCRSRFEQYRIMQPGEYIRLIEGNIAELIHVP